MTEVCVECGLVISDGVIRQEKARCLNCFWEKKGYHPTFDEKGTFLENVPLGGKPIYI